MKLLFLTNNIHTIGGIQQYSLDFLWALQENKANFRHLEAKNTSLAGKIIFVVRSLVIAFIYQPNFILVNHLNYSVLAQLLSVLTKSRYGLIVYGIDAWEIAGRKLKAVKRAGLIISLSEYTKKVMVEKGYALANQFIVIAPCVDATSIKPTDKPEYLLKEHNLFNKKIMLSLGRLSASERYKGYDRVVRALPAVLKIVPETRYIIVGDGDDKTRVEKLAQSLGVGKQVIFPGYKTGEERAAYYNLADVFVLPSTGEGFGIVYLEALACGVPVIAGNKDASPEPLLQGKAGTLVDPDSVTAIAQALINVLTGKVGPELLDKQYLRRAAIENFGYNIFKQKVAEFVNRIS